MWFPTPNLLVFECLITFYNKFQISYKNFKSNDESKNKYTIPNFTSLSRVRF